MPHEMENGPWTFPAQLSQPSLPPQARQWWDKYPKPNLREVQVEGQDALPPTIYRKASPPWKGIDEKVWEEVPTEREREREREYSNYWTSVL